MYIVVRGGLGNQMFQVAHALALSKKCGCEPRFVNFSSLAKVPRRWEVGCFGINQFHISLLWKLYISAACLFANRYPKYGSWLLKAYIDGYHRYYESATSSAPKLVLGYWQSPSCFADCEDYIRCVFSFQPTRPISELVDSTDLPIVAIHVRRGDYVSDPAASELHLVCDAQWYSNAWEYVRNELGDCQALVFSDDPQWAIENLHLSGKVSYASNLSEQEPWVDMALMSQCNHFIISNSSYSWWAAYLAKSPFKRVYAPKYWYRGQETAALEICPDTWHLL